MNRKSTSFINWKFYLPLSGLFLFVLFSLGLMHNAQEKEQQLSLLVQQVEQVQQNFGLAAVFAQKNIEEALPALALQLNNSIVHIEGTGTLATAPEKLNNEWQAIKSVWQNLKVQELQTASTGLKKEALVAQLDELQLRCQRLAMNLSEEQESSNSMQGYAFGVVLLLISCMVGYICYFMQQYLLRPLKALEKQVERLSSEQTIEEKTDTAAVGGFYATLQEKLLLYNTRKNYLIQASEQIGDGNFQQDEALLLKGGSFGHAVLALREKLKAYFQAEQRRSWGSQGMEQFTGLLREKSHGAAGVEVLCKHLVSELVPFVNANQGAIFISAASEQGEEVLQLKAAYAWNRHKSVSKTVHIGEGLLGQVAQEKEMVFITDVPEGYISIGSGLGRAKPRCILILPLIANNVFQGVLELASFHVYEPHELEFLKKLSETIASTLANQKSTNETKELLAKANAANANLQSQEEELRQNTEELMATQEAMRKKEIEMTGLFASIDFSLFTAEFDLHGTLLKANEKFQEYLGVQDLEQHTKRCFQLLQVPGWTDVQKKQFMDSLLQGKPQNLECSLVRNPGVWLSASFTPVLNANGQVLKVMMLASDISEKKNAELAYVAQAEEIMVQEEKLRVYTTELEALQAGLSDRLAEARQEMQRQIQEIAAEKAKNEAVLEGCVDGVVSFDEKGNVEYFNHAAEEIWQTSRMDVMGRKIQHLISIEIQQVGGEPQVYFVKNGSRKALDIRTEVPLISANGEEIEALLTLTRVKVENTYLFTAFVQKVAVELF